MRCDSKREFAPPTILLGLLLCPWTWGISSQLLQRLPSHWGFCFALERGSADTPSLPLSPGRPAVSPSLGFSGGSVVRNPSASAGEARNSASILGSGRSPGEGKGYPLQDSGLENSTDCIVHGVEKPWTRLSDFHFHYSLPLLANTQGWM